MRQTGRTLLEGGLLLALAGLLFRFPGQSAEAARQGVDLCLELILPSLFPFFVLSSLFIATGLAGLCARRMEGGMQRLFGVGGAGGSAFLLGLVGGYPVGARTLAQLVERGDCSRRDAGRLSLFCNNCGPAFFMGAVGVGIFGSRQAGLLLLVSNALAALTLGLVLHLLRDKGNGPTSSHSQNQNQNQTKPRSLTTASLPTVLPECVRTAFSSTLGVCAYVILFSVLTTLADNAGLLPGRETPLLRCALVGFLELSTGVAHLGEAEHVGAALPLAAFLLGWGGLSVHCQTLPFWHEAGVAPGPYLLAKFLQGLLAAGLTALGLHLLPLSLPTMATEPLSPCPSLWARESLALWALSGVYFLLAGKRGGNQQEKPL